MSEEKHENRVKRLMAEAHRCKSLTGLRGIARDLERLSAWSEAAEVDRMADADI